MEEKPSSYPQLQSTHTQQRPVHDCPSQTSTMLEFEEREGRGPESNHILSAEELYAAPEASRTTLRTANTAESEKRRPVRSVSGRARMLPIAPPSTASQDIHDLKHGSTSDAAVFRRKPVRPPSPPSLIRRIFAPNNSIFLETVRDLSNPPTQLGCRRLDDSGHSRSHKRRLGP